MKLFCFWNNYMTYCCFALGFPGGSMVKNLPVSAGDARHSRLIPGSGRSPGAGNGSALQCSCLEIPWQRSLAGYSPWDLKEWNTAQHSTALLTLDCIFACILKRSQSNIKHWGDRAHKLHYVNKTILLSFFRKYKIQFISCTIYILQKIIVLCSILGNKW